ncbi:hypothetical protein J2R99_002481 [Rhodopseudomonas julia]|uniref:BLUF domain-containing protein n=1 Tax=Rhodopseudomonas julia TaxID=200617 RepID=A0ABU0C8T5_9BRAD|nr:BLUF domain-containing protein [Rhodopseudomonas julia]MDQ0326612.1 hypothetical protein [Rhodopseudomonas julia]
MTADNKDLYRLVYYSRNRIEGSDDVVSREIAAILEISQINNTADELTGALIFNSGVFAQVLEGRRSAIEKGFERIQRDPRHSDVHVLFFFPVPERAFPNWSMAFIGRSRRGQNLFADLADKTGFEEARLQGERLFSIMREIAIDEELIEA